MAGRKKRSLTTEDQALWTTVAKTAVPLRRAPGLVQYTTSKKIVPAPEIKRKSPVEPVEPFEVGERSSPLLPRHQISAFLGEQLSRVPVRMDHGLHKKMLRGKLQPEATLDLHGLTLARAHPRLTAFMFNAANDGLRLVLVITGKGKVKDEDGPIPIRQGVLRHQVPQWLEAPPIGSLVLNIRQAHLRHGGGGAYYVYLRRRN
jgi:DNA-nicking Smr family endonuclease